VSSPYTLRPATDGDYDWLFALHVATLRPAVEATWGWDETYQTAYFREHFSARQNQIIVVGGQDAGVLKLEERDGDVFVGLVEIVPSLQGGGLGSQIIRDVVASAFARGQAVTLHVLKANDGARRLYERLGFQVVETRDVRHVMRIAPSHGAQE
jgi:ribosomal protein S18 acetylase RimI-like enzyme